MTSRACLPIALSLAVAACGTPERSDFQGYVEGEYLYLAAPQAGYLKHLNAPRGRRVADGEPLFEIAADPDDQALAEAQARAGAAREKLENLREPRRTPEIAALEAALTGAVAARRLAEVQLQRQQALSRQQFVSPAAVDDARARRDQAVAGEDAARQQLATARIALGRAP
ncbi:MAG TPA: secretion protein HlyD, partial [Rhodocyclaceae bacterium]|nr:secretion protein HlyD [Rhodocyclaceae bacterium]